MTSQRSELYGRADFLANCGGLLGLFLGASVISCLEIVYFCTIRLCFNRGINESRVDFARDSQRITTMLIMLRSLIADYSTKTTIQGVKYVANTKLLRIERFWWAIVLVISVFCCGSLMANLIKRYRFTPVTINLATDETPITDVRRKFANLLQLVYLI
jgi:Amiloride-sensitive sodium channel